MSAAELITHDVAYSATALIPSSDMDTGSRCQSTSRMRFRKDKTLLGFSDRKELNMEYLAAYLILFTICLLTVARIIPYQIPLVLVLIYAAKKQGENISRVDYPVCHLYRIIYFYRQPWKDSAIQGSFLERIMAGRGNTYCCSCQSDYEQCSRCASFIRLYR